MNTETEIANINAEIDMITDACPTIGTAFLRPENATTEERKYLDRYMELNDRLFDLIPYN